MNNQPNSSAATIDAALLAKLTGGLGDQKTVAKISTDIGHLYQSFLPDLLVSETGFTVEVDYLNCETGLMTDLVKNLSREYAVADCSLRNWCPNFLIGVGHPFIMALMERMLGSNIDDEFEAEKRSLTDIELDLATIVIGRISSVLRSSLNTAGGFEVNIDRPYNSNGKVFQAEELEGLYGMKVRLEITLGRCTSEFCLIIPQRALLKTKITTPKPSAQALKKQEEWMNLMSEQVKRSQITLQARIRLEDITLRTVSKLVAGDVIPFRDIKQDDICVEVSANGANMYNCEFGKAGDRYTVRVKNNVSTDDELLRHLMG